jgi:DNA (cytosine-5)-methyltransferase 1
VPTFGSLFAGIGGIDLGLERAGWECRWQVEIDPFCRHVLEHHWPDVPRYGDIRELEWSGVERVDLLAGGFPCQPFSVAGQRRGKDDERWLWPEFAAAVRALRPRHVLVENVPGLLAGHGGMGDVLGDLAQLGYDAEWDSVPAAAVGAPHLRYRVWIVAHADVVGGLGVRRLFDGFRSALGYDPDGRRSPLPDADSEQLWLQPAGLAWGDGTAIAGDAFGSLADSEREGLQGSTGSGFAGAGWTSGIAASGDQALADAECGRRDWGTPDAEWGEVRRASPVEAGADGRPSDHWLTEPDVGRVAHGVPSRVDRLRALGNAVVPQVVEVIGRRLLESRARRVTLLRAPRPERLRAVALHLALTHGPRLADQTAAQFPLADLSAQRRRRQPESDCRLRQREHLALQRRVVPLLERDGGGFPTKSRGLIDDDADLAAIAALLEVVRDPLVGVGAFVHVDNIGDTAYVVKML